MTFIKKALHYILVILSACLIGAQPILAQSITTTPISGSTNVYETANGVPIIDIETPNSQGVSHNIYGDFNVGTGGLIFNNVDSNFGNTRLGGQIVGNANLTNGSATVILNEVIYNNPSELNGYLEVAGASADVIIANPYGVTCDGCGFINTDRATITTGTPFYEGGDFKGFNVTRGTVAIGELGADATGVSRFDILSRKINFRGAIHGQEVNLIAGQNNVIYATGAVVERSNDGSATPEIAIDSTVLGGMYANSIKIISTEDGAGVRAPTTMAASAGEMTITADGRLVLGTAQASGDINVKVRDDIVIENQVYSQAKANLETARDLIAENNAQIVADSAVSVQAANAVRLGTSSIVIASGGAVVVDAGDEIALENGAQVLASGNVDITADRLVASENNLFAAGVESAEGNSEDADLSINVAGEVTFSASEVFASRELNFDAGSINIGSDEIAPSRFVAFGDARISAAKISAEGATIGSGGSLTIDSHDLRTTDAEVVAEGDLEINGLDSGALDINGGDYRAVGNLGVTASRIDNSADLSALTGVLDVDAVNGDLINEGALNSGNKVKLTSAGALTNSGAIVSSITEINVNPLDAPNAGQFTNTGDITTEILTVTATNFDNSASITANHYASINTSEAFNNAGAIAAVGREDFDQTGNILINAGTAITNTGSIVSGQILSLDGNNLTNSGRLEGAAVGVELANALTNDSDILATNGQMSITVANKVKNTGLLQSTTGQNAIKTAALTNTGVISANGNHVYIEASDRLNNTGGTIYSDIGVALRFNGVVNSSILEGVNSLGYLNLAAVGGGYLDGFTVLDGEEFGAIGDFYAKVKSVDNAGAIYSATGNLTLAVEVDVTNTGVLYAGGDNLRLLLGGTLDNDGGAVLANNNMLIAGVDYGTYVNAGADGIEGTDDDVYNTDSRASAIINQHEGRIETIQGDMVLVAGKIENRREYEIVTTQSSISEERGYRGNGVVHNSELSFITQCGISHRYKQNDPSSVQDGCSYNGIDYGDIGGWGDSFIRVGNIYYRKSYNGTSDYTGESYLSSITSNIEQVSIEFSESRSTISSGGSLSINAETLRNEFSTIAASTDIIMDVDNLNNVAGESYSVSNSEFTIVTATSDFYGEIADRYAIGGFGRIEIGDSPHMIVETLSGRSRPRSEGGSESYRYVGAILGINTSQGAIYFDPSSYGLCQSNPEYISGNICDFGAYFSEKDVSDYEPYDELDLFISDDIVRIGQPRYFNGHFEYTFSIGPTGKSDITPHFGTIQASGNIVGYAGDFTNGIEENVVALPTRGDAPTFTARSNPSEISGSALELAALDISHLAVGDIANSNPALASLADDPLFTIAPDPSSGYLIESRYDFIDQSAFASSDYFLTAIGIVPVTEAPFRLGDAFVETNYIRNQIFEKTGLTILEPGLSEADQIRRMYDSAVDAQTDLSLRPGVALTPAQQAALTEDIIWLETQIVNGQEVLVPIVYFADGGAQYAALDGGQLRSGGTINLQVDNFANNGGSIIANEQVVISATNDIINNGGLIQGGVNGQYFNTQGIERVLPSVVLTAEGDIANYSGVITGEDVLLSATNIINETQKIRFGDETNYSDIALSTASIGGSGDLTLVADNDITMIGADVSTGGNANIRAGNDVTFGALELESAFYSGGGKNFSQGYSLTNQVTDISVGQNLTIVSAQTDDNGEVIGGGNIVFDGATVDAGGAIGVAAYAGNVEFNAVQDISTYESRSSSKGLISSSSSHTQSYDLTHQTASLTGASIDVKAAGSVTAYGTDFTTVGADGEALSGENAAAAGTLAIEAGNGDIAFYAVQDVSAYEHESSSSVLGGLISSDRESKSLETRYNGVNLASVSDVNLTAKRDIVIQGGSIEAIGDINPSAGGSIYIQGTVDTSYSYSHSNVNNGFTITDTTDVDQTQTASMPSMTAGGANGFATVDNAVIGGRGFKTDDDGNIVLDDDGNPIVVVGKTHATGIVSISQIQDPNAEGDEFTPLFGGGGDGDGEGGGDPFADSTTTEIASINPGGVGYEYLDALVANEATNFDLDDESRQTTLTQIDHYEQTVAPGVLTNLAVQVGSIYFTGGLGLTAGTWQAAVAGSVFSTTVTGVITGDLDFETVVLNAALAYSGSVFSSQVGGFLGENGLNLSTDSPIGALNGIWSDYNLAHGAVMATYDASINTLVYDGDFGDNLAGSFTDFGINQAMAGVHFGIGEIRGGEGSIFGTILHGAAGCTFSTIQGGECANGAAGAIITDVTVGVMYRDGASRDEVIEASAVFNPIISALTSGGDTDQFGINQNTAGSLVENNYLNHDQTVSFVREVTEKCVTNGFVDDVCVKQVYNESYERLSHANRQSMLSCKTKACWDMHLAELRDGIDALGHDEFTQVMNVDQQNVVSSIFDTVTHTNSYSQMLATQPLRQQFSFWCADKNTISCNDGYEAWYEDIVSDVTAEIIADNLPNLGDVSLFVNDNGEIVAIPNFLDAKELGYELLLGDVDGATQYLKWTGRILGPTGDVLVELGDDDGWTWRDTVTVPSGIVGGVVGGALGSGACAEGGPAAAVCGFAGVYAGAEVGSRVSGAIYDYQTYNWEVVLSELEEQEDE